MTPAKGKIQIGRTCCGCSPGAAAPPRVIFHACVGTGAVVIVCECRCHREVSE